MNLVARMLRPLAYWARRRPRLASALRRLLHRHPVLIRMATRLLHGRPVAAPAGRVGAPMAHIGLDDDPGPLDIEELLARVRAERAAQDSVAAKTAATATATPAGAVRAVVQQP